MNLNPLEQKAYHPHPFVDLMGIKLSPCVLTRPSLDDIMAHWRMDGHFNEELYKLIENANKTENSVDIQRKNGIYFSYDKDSKTLQAFTFRI